MKYVTSIERLAAKKAHADGKEEGKEEGKKEGKEEGRLQAKRETVLQILQFRFQPDDTLYTLIETHLLSVAEEVVLKKLINDALEVDTIADFQRRLPVIQPASDQLGSQT